MEKKNLETICGLLNSDRCDRHTTWKISPNSRELSYSHNLGAVVW